MKTIIILKYQVPDYVISKLVSSADDSMIIYADNLKENNKSLCDTTTFFNPLSPEFEPVKEIKNFLGKEKDYSIVFYFHFRGVAFLWIFSLYTAGLKNIQWLGADNTLERYFFLKIVVLKIKQAICSRLNVLINNHMNLFYKIILILNSVFRQIVSKVFTCLRITNSCGLTAKWLGALERVSFLFKISSELNYLVKEPAKERLPQNPEKLKIINFIGTLGSGGSERQLCNFVTGIKAQGYSNLRILTYRPLEGHDAHSLPIIEKAGLSVSSVDFSIPYMSHPGIDLVPLMIRKEVYAIYNEIMKDPPAIFHSWLDYTNILGGLAALFAGVPVIILSTRSVSPYHFPYLFKPWFRPYYQFLAKSPRVRFINNSENGGLDYAEWLGLPHERFKTVLNGVDFEEIKKIPIEEIRKFRESLGIDNDVIIICGVFRLTSEKRPQFFFKIADAILRKYKNVCVIHAGDGPEKECLINKIQKKGWQSRFKLLGRRKDISVLLSASNILLLTSENEGTPNVILEAGWLGCCAVSTAVGGVPDCIEDAKTGFIHPVNDEAGLIKSISTLIENADLRKKISEEAPEFIKEKFSLEKMLSETLELYK